MRRDELIFILGGARAGKSHFAQQLAEERAAATSGRVCLIATAEALDDEMRTRIARHRAERPSDWQTIEEPRQLDEALRQAGDARIVIVDCLTLFVSNWLLAAKDVEVCEQRVTSIIDEFLLIAKGHQQTIICVSNEVGWGIVPDTHSGRVFRDMLGKVNQRFARAADYIYLLIAGLPIRLKSPHGASDRHARRDLHDHEP